jgi:hypothetical protein
MVVAPEFAFCFLQMNFDFFFGFQQFTGQLQNDYSSSA